MNELLGITRDSRGAADINTKALDRPITPRKVSRVALLLSTLCCGSLPIVCTLDEKLSVSFEFISVHKVVLLCCAVSKGNLLDRPIVCDATLYFRTDFKARFSSDYAPKASSTVCSATCSAASFSLGAQESGLLASKPSRGAGGVSRCWHHRRGRGRKLSRWAIV